MERCWELRRPPPLFDSYNVTPTQQVPVIRELKDEGREAVLMRRGLISTWTKGIPQKYSTINARAERMQTAPVYRNAWRRGQRCLIPANGFYEWQSIPGQKQNQPYYIQITDPDYMAGDSQFTLAGLWERSPRDDGEVVESFTIITMPANGLMAEIHNSKQRMPLIFAMHAYHDWLAGTTEEAKDWLVAYPSGIMDFYKISTYVNSPANNDPRCIETLVI